MDRITIVALEMNLLTGAKSNQLNKIQLIITSYGVCGLISKVMQYTPIAPI